MLLFIILALLVVLTKSLIPPAATEVDFTFDAAVVIAGLFSYIGLVGFIFRRQRPTGESLDCSRRGAFAAKAQCEAIDHLQQDVAARPAGRASTGSSLVRRLVLAKDDPAKQRIRAQLSEIDDERLRGLGLTSEDIAALRDTESAPAEAAIVQGLDAASEDSSAYQISPPIADVSDATDDGTMSAIGRSASATCRVLAVANNASAGSMCEPSNN